MNFASMTRASKPACVPDDVTHVEFTAQEALRDFKAGREDTGVINLAHSLYIALVKREEVSEERARELFNELSRGRW